MAERRVVKLHGPPGTGKTTWLMNQLEQVLRRGVPPERIGFVSFSRRALAVARERASQITPGELTHFRTIHATAYHMLGLSRSDVIQHTHLKEVGELLGFPLFSPSADDAIFGASRGAQIMGLLGLAAARREPLRSVWHAANPLDVPWALVSRTAHLYDRYKRERGLWDFHDMIAQATGTLDVDVLFIDEAQDTSIAQWTYVREIAKHVPEIYIAGDDDQAVYGWSGADPGTLLKIHAQHHVHLPQSYRLPGAVKTLADRIVHGIRVRVPKTFTARHEPGAVQFVQELDHINLREGASWLLLARSNYQLESYREMARAHGVVYSLSDGEWSWTLPSIQAALAHEHLRKGHTIPRKEAVVLSRYSPRACVVAGATVFDWDTLYPQIPKENADWMRMLSGMSPEEKEYLRALRRSGESLKHPGRVTISTIHGAKGEEADHVVLQSDISRRVALGMQHDPDAERRVQYVGVTRAKHQLTILHPRTQSFWAWP